MPGFWDFCFAARYRAPVFRGFFAFETDSGSFCSHGILGNRFCTITFQNSFMPIRLSRRFLVRLF